MRDARYVRLISWTLQSGSEQTYLFLMLFSALYERLGTYLVPKLFVYNRVETCLVPILFSI